MSAHTPTPWTVKGEPGYTGFMIADAGGRSICPFPSNAKRPDAERVANAALIVEAVNSHASLLAEVARLEYENTKLLYALERCDEVIRETVVARKHVGASAAELCALEYTRLALEARSALEVRRG